MNTQCFGGIYVAIGIIFVIFVRLQPINRGANRNYPVVIQHFIGTLGASGSSNY